MKDQHYIEQLKDIRTMMDRSSRFLSLSGLSGILAGVYAIIGAFAVRSIIQGKRYMYITLESREFRNILFIAAAVVVLSLLTGVLLSARKAQKRNEKLWNSASRRLVINFSIPMITGGIFGILLLRQQHYGLISAVTMLFYGMALLNSSKYTLETVRSLGISFIVLGLITTAMPGYSLEFWTIGFGGFHILYGTIMYIKFDRKTAA